MKIKTLLLYLLGMVFPAFVYAQDKQNGNVVIEKDAEYGKRSGTL